MLIPLHQQSIICSGQGGIRTHTPFRTDASKASLSRQFQHLAIIIIRRTRDSNPQGISPGRVVIYFLTNQDSPPQREIIKIHFCIDRGYQFRHFPKYRERWIRTTISFKIIFFIALVNCCMYLIRAERGTRTHEEFPPQFCRLCPLPLGFTSAYKGRFILNTF